VIRLGLLAWVVFSLVAPNPAGAENPDPDECRKSSNFAYLTIPGLFYSNQPDSLFGVVMAWEDACGEVEPILRLKILAAIWDDAFTEGIYDHRIIDHLIWRNDPEREREISGEVNPGLASGDVASPADFAVHVDQFDTFTENLANQLLPHMSPGSVESFFCLFYSGQTDAAYEMLHGKDLTGTDLRWYYQREMSLLREDVARTIFALTSGVWRPEGDLLRVGDHAMVGVTVGRRKGRWLGRLVGEFRPGRSAHPYYVEQGDISGWSDRFDGLYFGLEVGRELGNFGPHRIDLFLGLGYDGIKPFLKEDLFLGTVNANLGFGYRLFLGSRKNWVAGFDSRFEYIGMRNAGGTSLSGEAVTLRFSLGYSPGSGKNRRLSGLGH
jgi:hypothetical protein